MLSSVLRTSRAIAVNIEIMRAFVRLRRLHGEHSEFGRRLDELEAKYQSHDSELKTIFDAIRALMQPTAQPRRPIVFRAPREPTCETRSKPPV